MNSKKQGDIGLGIAISWFTKNGYTVAIPLTDSQEYDLLVDLDDKISRVQVKSTSGHDVELRTLGSNSKGNKIIKYSNVIKYDLLFASTVDGYFLIPKEKFQNHKRSISTRRKWKEFCVFQDS